VPFQSKSPDTIYKGHSTWLKVPNNYEAKPGENVIITDDIVRKIPRNGFEITYLTYLFDMFDKLAGKKYAVVKYILENKSRDNTLIITTRELAKKSGVGLNTVVTTLKLLKEANLIQTRNGAIMLSPKIAHRGTNKTEKYLLQKFEAFSDEIDPELEERL
jgi:DNA-binding transcriptional regulator YhcF (GntR family)